MKVKIILIIIVVTQTVFLYGIEKKSSIYSGGAQLHMGYGFINSDYGQITGLLLGIGGRIHFNIGKYFRVGSGGAVTKFNYKSEAMKGTENYEKSYFQIGYGGITAEFKYRFKKFQFAVGFLVGGGSVTNMHFIRDNGDGMEISDFTEQPAFIITPTLIFEFFIKESLSLSIQIDYLFSNKLLNDFQLGPRIYIGIFFNK